MNPRALQITLTSVVLFMVCTVSHAKAHGVPTLARRLSSLPLCMGDATTWNAGHGSCKTYSPWGGNRAHCGSDSAQGFTADQACSECGSCQTCPESIHVAGAQAEPSNSIGNFTRATITPTSQQQDRPIYINGNNQYLYFLSDSARWHIGPDYTSVLSADLKSASDADALCPSSAWGWLAWDGNSGHWASAYTITVGEKKPQFFLKSYGSCAYNVMSVSQCSAAAAALGLTNTTVSNDDHIGVTPYDPPGCYYEDGSLKFNSVGWNTGSCSASDLCVCQDAPAAPVPTPVPTPSPTPVLAPVPPPAPTTTSNSTSTMGATSTAGLTEVQISLISAAASVAGLASCCIGCWAWIFRGGSSWCRPSPTSKESDMFVGAV